MNKNIRMTARRLCLPFLQVLWSFWNRDYVKGLVHTNPDIFWNRIFPIRIRVDWDLNGCGERFQNNGRGFDVRIHWFRVNERSFRLKQYAVSKISGFVWTEPKRKRIYLVNEVFAVSCRRRYESSVPFSLVLFTRVYNIYSVYSQ